MKCPKCGGNNSANAHYCGNCGTALPKKLKRKIYCLACGFENKGDARFCVACGAELFHPAKSHKKVSSASKASAPKKTVSGNPTRHSPVFTWGAALILIMALSIGVIVQNRTGSSSPNSVALSSVSDPLLEAEVLEVAAKFRCSCQTCGGTPLDECSCDTAIEEKNFIREKLKEGHKTPHIIAMVKETYGWLKPEFEEDANILKD